MSMARAKTMLRLWPTDGGSETLAVLEARYQHLGEGVTSDLMPELMMMVQYRLIKAEGGAWHLTGEGVKLRKAQPPPPHVEVVEQGSASRGSWAQAMGPAHATSRSSSLSAGSAELRKPVGTSAAAPAMAAVEWLPMDAPEVETGTTDADSPWALFRRVMAYYISCIQLEERPNISLYGDKLHRDFIPLTFRGRWYPEEQERNNVLLRLPLAPGQADFWRRVFGADDAQSLMLGYPLHVINRPDYCLVRPIGIVPVSLEEDDADQVNLILQFEDMSINSSWVEHNLKQEEARPFLARAGMNSFDADDEEVVTLGPSVGKLCRALEVFAGDKLRGAPDPLNIPWLSAPEQLEDGVHNACVLFLEKRNNYNASLLRELRQIASASDKNLDRTALRYMYLSSQELAKVEARVQRAQASASSVEIADRESLAVPFLDMNDEQERAVTAALCRPLTVVTGPPGTGKSQVAANLLANLAWQRKSAVFCSRNHKAIDAVVPRTNALVSDGRELVVRQSDGTVEGRRFSWKNAIRQALSMPPAHRSLSDVQQLSERLKRLLRQRTLLVSQAERWATLEQDLSKCQEAWDEFEAVGDSRQVTVVRETGADRLRQLEAQCIALNLPLYAGAPAGLLDHLRRILWQWRRQPAWQEAIVQLNQALEEVVIKGVEPQPLASVNEVLADRAAAVSVLAGYAETLSAISNLEHEVKALRKLSDVEAEVAEVVAAIRQLGPEILDANLDLRIHDFTQEQRTDLLTLRNIFGNLNAKSLSEAQRGRLMARVEESLPVLLQMYPLWATTAQSARHILPLVAGCVDLAIIDEASQCDVASMIPVLYRARRAVIIGDPMQLRPVIRLKSARNHLLLAEHHLVTPEAMRFDFRQGSLFELADSAPTDVLRIMLQCHFRCARDIAAYFNQAYYRESLFVLTDAARLKVPVGKCAGIVWTEVQGQAEHGGGPNSAAICREEIEAVGQLLEHLRDEGYSGSVGVICPFRPQALRIADRAEKILGAAVINAWEFECNTVHSFQGGERDLIIVSLCYQPGLTQGSLWAIESVDNTNLWNVAASRARAILHVVGNRTMCRNSTASHLKLLADPPEPPKPDLRYQGFQSPWERILHDALASVGVATVTQYPLVGRYLDLAVPDAKLDIEVDGERWHRDRDGRRKADDLWRDLQVKSAGWKVIRFWVYELREDLPRCTDAIRAALIQGPLQ